jgi:DNA-binding NarL/FixJ family response regulator
MAAIFRALNVSNRTEATIAARNLGLYDAADLGNTP